MFMMSGQRNCCLLVVFSSLLVVCTTATRANCMLGADGTNYELTSCLQKGEEYLRAYTKHLKRKSDDFETCPDYEEFRACITPLTEQCRSIRNHLKESWLPIISFLSCSCNGTTHCEDSLQCFEEESNDLLVERCDALYKFNIRQHTRDKCYFLQQNVKCKEALVRTGCGSEAGVFAFYVAKMFRRKKLDKMQMDEMPCPVSMDVQYDDFQYTEACPRSFKEKLSTCEDLYLIDNTIVFYEDNELVANAGNKDVRKACRGFRQYRQCVRPIKHTCPLGTDVMYGYDSRLRTYLLKLDFICRVHKTDYLDNLVCYQDVLVNHTLLTCNPIWDGFKPLLSRVTSYRFYCEREEGDTQLLQRQIDKLRLCYTDVFKASCGEVAGDVIGQLIARAFEDPFYLRMQYRPRCSHHKRPRVPVARATNVQLTTFGQSAVVEGNENARATTQRTLRRPATRTRSGYSSSSTRGSATLAHALSALLCLLVVYVTC